MKKKGHSGFTRCGMILIIGIPMGAEYLMNPTRSLWHAVARLCCFQEKTWCVSLKETGLSDWNRALKVDYAVWKHSGESLHSELTKIGKKKKKHPRVPQAMCGQTWGQIIVIPLESHMAVILGISLCINWLSTCLEMSWSHQNDSLYGTWKCNNIVKHRIHMCHYCVLPV